MTQIYLDEAELFDRPGFKRRHFWLRHPFGAKPCGAAGDLNRLRIWLRCSTALYGVVVPPWPA